MTGGWVSFAFAATGVAAMVADVAACGLVKPVRVTCERYESGTVFDVRCWASEGATDGGSAVYVFLEWQVDAVTNVLQGLMLNRRIPPGVALSLDSGWLPPTNGGQVRKMRAEEFDQPGTEFPSALIGEIIPAAERALGVKAAPSPDLHFIAGASSGGIAAWNACWFRNDWFRRAYCNSPTFSNMRGGDQLLSLVRKCETRPIRAYVTCGTDEPDYFFGDSYLAAENAVSALRFAGYEMRFDRFAYEGHGAKWGDISHLEKVLSWLFEGWRSQKVVASTNPLRVRNVLEAGSGWEACDFRMPPPQCTARSVDGERIYSVASDCRFVMSERAKADGTRDQRFRLAPLELAWNATYVGGTALAMSADGRVWVATELGVQGVVDFGLTDVILPLPDDLPCDNVFLCGQTLYAASGAKVFRRRLRVGAADAKKKVAPSTPGYDDGFWYSREHEPAGGIGELLGTYVTAGRIRGAISVVCGKDGKRHVDVAGWSDGACKMAFKSSDADRYCPVDSLSRRFLFVNPRPGCADGEIRLRRDWEYEADNIESK